MIVFHSRCKSLQIVGGIFTYINDPICSSCSTTISGLIFYWANGEVIIKADDIFLKKRLIFNSDQCGAIIISKNNVHKVNEYIIFRNCTNSLIFLVF